MKTVPCCTEYTCSLRSLLNLCTCQHSSRTRQSCSLNSSPWVAGILQLYSVLHGRNSRDLSVPKPGPTYPFLSKIVPCLMQEQLPVAVVWLEQVTWPSLGMPVPAQQDLPCLTFGVVIKNNCSFLAESVALHWGSYGDSVMTIENRK